MHCILPCVLFGHDIQGLISAHHETRYASTTKLKVHYERDHQTAFPKGVRGRKNAMVAAEEEAFLLSPALAAHMASEALS
jgi:hypothetical protein